MEFTNERERADLESAWIHAWLQKIDNKRFPRRPSDLWKGKETAQAQTPDEMFDVLWRATGGGS